MTVIDLTIVNVSLPTIGRDLHFSQTNLQWVVTAYALTFGENRWPPMGRISGHHRGLSMAATGEIPMAAVRWGERGSSRTAR
jgi:MFS family permease